MTRKQRAKGKRPAKDDRKPLANESVHKPTAERFSAPKLAKAVFSRVLSELGKIGGRRRSEAMSAAERKRLASKAAQARWKKVRQKAMPS